MQKGWDKPDKSYDPGLGNLRFRSPLGPGHLHTAEPVRYRPQPTPPVRDSPRVGTPCLSGPFASPGQGWPHSTIPRLRATPRAGAGKFPSQPNAPHSSLG